ncbi:hypothetical protein KQ751_16075, partial [Listeria monocytogenes]|nr:hypothetical protein [Listeria monocytogenes]
GQAIAQLLGAHLGVGQAGAHLFRELLPPLGHAQAQFEDLPAGTAEAAEGAWLKALNISSTGRPTRTLSTISTGSRASTS